MPYRFLTDVKISTIFYTAKFILKYLFIIFNRSFFVNIVWLVNTHLIFIFICVYKTALLTLQYQIKRHENIIINHRSVIIRNGVMDVQFS